MPKKRQRKKFNEQEATAFHESGHAVVAHVCGFRVKSISVIARELKKNEISLLGLNGHVAGSVAIDYRIRASAKEPQTRRWAKRNMDGWGMGNCAGGLAELKYLKSTQRKRGVDPGCLTGDGRTIVFLAVAYFKRDKAKANAWVRKIVANTEKLLNRRDVWNAVSALAVEVLRCGRITGTQARNIIDHHTSAQTHAPSVHGKAARQGQDRRPE